MSRYAIEQSDIDSLDMDQLEDLRMTICNEMDRLGQLEHMIYRHRRELELTTNPELAHSPQPDDIITLLHQAARDRGVSLESLIISSLNE